MDHLSVGLINKKEKKKKSFLSIVLFKGIETEETTRKQHLSLLLMTPTKSLRVRTHAVLAVSSKLKNVSRNKY